jgi:hypothetical protein
MTSGSTNSALRTVHVTSGKLQGEAPDNGHVTLAYNG